MKILQVETFGHGGLAHYVHNLTGALAERGHRVTLMTTVGAELEKRAVLSGGARLLPALGRWSQGRSPTPGRVAAALRRIEAIVDVGAAAAAARELAPDVIHLHCTNPIALAYLALLRSLGRPLVYTAHVVTPHEPMPLQRAVFGRAHRLADRVIAHSRFDRGRLVDELDVAASSISVIPHGDYGFFDDIGEPTSRRAARDGLGLAENDRVALFFGYVREYKGLDTLLEAWPRVAAAVADARLVVAGSPERLTPAHRDELAARATSVGALHRFGYVPVSEIRRYFAAADVLVLPYRAISQSGVLYLGLSLGVPVVATTVGGLPEVLDDHNSGLLVPPDAPEALAAALIEVLRDGALRRRLAHGGRAVAARHGWPQVAERTEDVYRQLVAERRTS